MNIFLNIHFSHFMISLYILQIITLTGLAVVVVIVLIVALLEVKGEQVGTGNVALFLKVVAV